MSVEHQSFPRKRAPSCGQWEEMTAKKSKSHTELEGRGSQSCCSQAYLPHRRVRCNWWDVGIWLVLGNAPHGMLMWSQGCNPWPHSQHPHGGGPVWVSWPRSRALPRETSLLLWPSGGLGLGPLAHQGLPAASQSRFLFFLPLLFLPPSTLLPSPPPPITDWLTQHGFPLCRALASFLSFCPQQFSGSMIIPASYEETEAQGNTARKYVFLSQILY